ncbi:SPOR domain-containing protein [candidate division KSB1 bacterium]|nr:SPOR domain-containing protein [candidate division KSB1 bacterium]
MKIFKVYLSVFILILFFMTNCSGPNAVRKNNRNEKSPETGMEMNENFDPLSLGDYITDIPEKKDSKTSFYDINQFIKGDAQDSVNSGELVSGYRVQLISTRNEAEARTVKLDAMLSFPSHIYMIFDNPYYKIRVGDFISRFDANELQEIAVKKGFNEAWVVKTNVYKQPQSVEEK